MRVKDKVEEIEKYLEELSSFVPNNFDEYKNDFKVKAACERYFEKIAEAVVDLCFLIIKNEGLENPEDDSGVFVVLLNNNIISRDVYKQLKSIKSMRNILAHKYGVVDDEVVFHSITEELENDVNEFINRVKEIIK